MPTKRLARRAMSVEKMKMPTMARENEELPPPRSSSTETVNPSTAAAPFSSFSKTVLLDDWWLIKSDTDYNGKKLAVAGKEVQGNHEVTIFTSTPIVERYDAFSVKTADGITLIFQGIINKHRAHQNGIPPEVSQCFLYGFPYNWESYAIESIFTASPTSSSNNGEPLEQSSDDAGKVFPIRAYFMRLLGALTSSPQTDSIDDVLRRHFNCTTRESNGSIPVDAVSYPSSEITNCHAPVANTNQHVETFGRHETDNNNQNNKHNEGCARRIGHDSVWNTIGHAGEAGCSSNELHNGVHGESSEINNTVIRNHCSLLTVDKNCEKQNEAGQGFRINPLQKKEVELEKNENLAKHVAMNSDTVAHMPDDNEGELNGESNTNSVDLIFGGVSNALSPKEREKLHLLQCNQQENYVAKLQNHAEKTRVQDVGVSEDLLPMKDSVGKASDSLIGKMSLSYKTSFESLPGHGQRNGDNENSPNPAGLPVKVASNDMSPAIRSYLRESHRRKLGGYTLSLGRAERIRVQTYDDSEVLAVRKVTNRNEGDSLPAMTGMIHETAVKLTPNIKKRKLTNNLTINSAISAVERVSDNLLLTEGDDLHHKPGRRRSGYALRNLDHVGKTGGGTTGISEDSLEKKDAESVTNSFDVEMNVLDIDTRKVCKAPKTKASQGDNNLSRAKGKTMHEFQSPLAQGRTKKLSVTSPELLNLKRSKSGRVLVPPIDNWRQQRIIYDMDRSIIAIAGIDTLKSPCKGNKLEPPKKRKLHK